MRQTKKTKTEYVNDCGAITSRDKEEANRWIVVVELLLVLSDAKEEDESYLEDNMFVREVRNHVWRRHFFGEGKFLGNRSMNERAGWYCL